MKPLPILVAAFATLPFVGRAQQPAPSPAASATPAPLPAGPLLKRAPDPSRWIVTYTSVKPAAGASPSSATPAADSKPKPPARMVVTRSGQYRHAVSQEVNGKESEVWCQGAIEVFIRPEWQQPMIADGSNRYDALFIDFSHSDFPGFEWINARNYTGIQKYAGRDCIIFQDSVVVSDTPVSGKPTPKPATLTASPQAAAEGTLIVTACVDLETRLPVVLRRGDAITAYQFDKPPDEPLALPPNVQAVLDARVKRQQELNRKPR